MKLSVAVVGNGTLSPTYIEKIKFHNKIIGVDRAAYWLLEQGIVPDIAIGDFDSVTEQELAVIRKRVSNINVFSPQKDFTDMELGVQSALALNSSTITLFGGIGSRWDHSLGNIFLLEHYHSTSVQLYLVNETNVVQLVTTSLEIPHSTEFTYLSVLSLTEESMVTLKGFKYDIAHYTIKRGQTIGVSNEIEDKIGVITVHTGKILLIRSRD